jgi:hypothetical protein
MRSEVEAKQGRGAEGKEKKETSGGPRVRAGERKRGGRGAGEVASSDLLFLCPPPPPPRHTSSAFKTPGPTRPQGAAAVRACLLDLAQS